MAVHTSQLMTPSRTWEIPLRRNPGPLENSRPISTPGCVISAQHQEGLVPSVPCQAFLPPNGMGCLTTPQRLLSLLPTPSSFRTCEVLLYADDLLLIVTGDIDRAVYVFLCLCFPSGVRIGKSIFQIFRTTRLLHKISHSVERGMVGKTQGASAFYQGTNTGLLQVLGHPVWLSHCEAVLFPRPPKSDGKGVRHAILGPVPHKACPVFETLDAPFAGLPTVSGVSVDSSGQHPLSCISCI